LPELRISDVPDGPGGQRRVELTWSDGNDRQAAVVKLAGPQAGDQDSELIRWYLEEYAEYPAAPAPERARRAEAALASAGSGLFDRVFATRDAMMMWALTRDRLGSMRVVVDADPGAGPGLAWELLRDPAGDSPVALAAGEFVRVHRQAARHPGRPEPSGDVLRVLLVIARPGREDDVPFRSVASRLVRSGVGRMEGLDLDVLRPATFARLSQVLRAAYAAGRPYHVVHFDGHGDWLDLAKRDAASGGGSRIRYQVPVAGPIRNGSHGYLLFEDPGSEENVQYVDGPSLGKLLAATGVPVLVLNACRSAYSEPGETPGAPNGQGPTASSAAEGADRPTASNATEGPVGPDGDVHARVRAYGSLAVEIADAGVPGVVAMRYVVYVVTAAQFIADLYAHLVAGESLGRAAGEARRALAADPMRQVGLAPVMLQDWVVPVVYEAAPLVLLTPQSRTAPLLAVTPPEGRALDEGLGLGPDGLPRPPDAGFFGRDETLLALDRAFDTQQVVLLHAFAGAGKSTTAAEFARWYTATGGLDLPDRPEWDGEVLWSSFEHHLTADQLVGQVGDTFTQLLEANGIAWAAITDPAQRRGVMLQVLAQLPVLWIWDNTEPVAGFPEGAPSDWTAQEQAGLTALLRDLAQQTRCKVLLTSRRDEHGWLGDLPARVRLPRMPMREAIQLANALAARHGAHLTAAADWRPLLRYAAGNPLTITVLTGQALRENATTSTQIQSLVTRLRAGETELEAGEDEALGRTRSLAASLSYGFTQAFTDIERAQLAVLHLFRDTIDADALRGLGDPQTAGEYAMPELAGLTRDTSVALLDRATSIGLLETIGVGYYQIHPALPWYFTALFDEAYGLPGSPAVQRATRSYVRVSGRLGNYYFDESQAGHSTQVLPAIQAEENNLRHALDLARAHRLWDAAVGCLQSLRVLFERTGRDSEWARLVRAVTPDFIDPATGGPQPDREDYWSIITGYQVRLARTARDWPVATALQDTLTTWDRDRASVALTTPPDSVTPRQRFEIRTLVGSLSELGGILSEKGDPGCLAPYEEAMELCRRIGDRQTEAEIAGAVGNVYSHIPGLRNLDQAEHWYQSSLTLRDPADQYGRALCLGSLGGVAMDRFDDAIAAGEPEPVLNDYLNAALRGYLQALDLTHVNDHQTRAITENALGLIYRRASDTRQALHHFQQAIQHEESRRNIYGAGQARYNVALLLVDDNRTAESLLYARAALDNFHQAGPGAASDAAEAEQLITFLDRPNQAG
jgi:tetratricopeptide (TPR) repeat protein